MSKPQYSPLPWRYDQKTMALKNAHDIWVADTTDETGPRIRDAVNSHAHTTNSHDALLAVAVDVRTFDRCRCGPVQRAGCQKCVHCLAEAAIALAEAGVEVTP